METILITGKFRKQPAQVFYKRRKAGKGWAVSVTVVGKTGKYTLEGNSWKPCWTVATKLMKKLLPEVPSKRRAIQVDHEEGMVIPFKRA